MLISTSAEMESGVRYDTIRDQTIGQARDLFACGSSCRDVMPISRVGGSGLVWQSGSGGGRRTTQRSVAISSTSMRLRYWEGPGEAALVLRTHARPAHLPQPPHLGPQWAAL